MKLKALQCFWALVQHGYNVTAAAESLHLSQPAVSKQIKGLEDALGRPLFRRQQRQLLGLTDTGQAMLPEVEKILQAMERLQALARRPGQSWQEFNLGAEALMLHHRLASVWPAWQKRFPGQRLHLQEGSRAQLLHMLQERNIDLAWFSGAVPPEALPLQLLPLEDEPLLLLLPAGHPWARDGFPGLEALAQQALIGDLDADGLLPALRAARLKPRLLLTARQGETIKNYVRQGLGLGIVPAFAHDPTQDGDLCALPLAPHLPPRRSYLAWHRDARLGEAYYFFMEQCSAGRIQRHNYRGRLLHSSADDWVI